ncbi:MAG: hypothetical protein PHG95_02485 [Patescibacteria group bacterium]|nr:hypothetical protein [Patescibacteria group bacterium]
MTDNDFLKQLKGLKNISPEASWLKSNREILLSQIANSGAKELAPYRRLLIDVRSFFAVASQPALALGSFLVLLVGVSLFGHLAFSRTKPNESLYIARIISEKAKLTTVFDSQEREKMEVQFAASHAEAITEVLAGTDVNDEAQVAKLNDSFNKELATVRTKIAGIKKGAQVALAPTEVAPLAEEDLLLTAGDGKDDAGMQIALNNGTALAAPTASVLEADKAPAEVATPTEAVTVAEESSSDKAEEALNEAQSLFENKEYSGALDKLKEVKEMIK